MAETVTAAKATARTVRIAPRKARLVVDTIRGKSAAEAISILRFTNRGASEEVEKVLMSAKLVYVWVPVKELLRAG